MFNRAKDLIYRWLRKSERYTKTDMVYLAKGGFWLTLAQGFSSVSALVIAVAFANLIPKETFGEYKYIISIFSLFSIACLSGIDTALTRAMAQGYEGEFFRSLKIKIKWGFLGTLAGLITSAYYFFNHNTYLAVAFLIVALFVPFFNGVDIYQAYLIGQKKFRQLSILSTIAKIVPALILITTIFFTGNLYIILIAFFLPQIIIKIIYVWIIYSRYRLNNNIDPEALNYGKHLSVFDVMSIIVDSIDKILIFHLLGPVNLAIYYFAIAPIAQIKGLLKNINILALPKFSEQSKENIKQAIFGKMFQLGIFLTVITVIYIYLVPIVYGWFFPQYSESIWYAQVYAFSIVTLINLLPLVAMQSLALKKQLYIFNISSSLFQIIVLVTFISLYGLFGAIMARLASRAFAVALNSYLIKKS